MTVDGVRLERGGAELLDLALRIRMPVFVEEQGVPASLERDEHDLSAIHVIAWAGKDLAGTGRVYFLDPSTVRIGRMAIVQSQRRRGLGTRILRELEAAARAAGATRAVLHAQRTAEGFYGRAGYRPVGEPYDEAGIPHITMVRELAGPG